MPRRKYNYEQDIPFLVKAKYFGLGAIFSPAVLLSLLFYGWETSLFIVGMFVFLWIVMEQQ